MEIKLSNIDQRSEEKIITLNIWDETIHEEMRTSMVISTQRD